MTLNVININSMTAEQHALVDTFAAHALAGLLSNVFNVNRPNVKENLYLTEVAKMSYEYAYAALAERERIIAEAAGS